MSRHAFLWVHCRLISTVLHCCFRTGLCGSLSSWFGPMLREVTTVIQLLASGQAPGIGRLTFITSTLRAWSCCFHDCLYMCAAQICQPLNANKPLVFSNPGLCTNSFISFNSGMAQLPQADGCFRVLLIFQNRNCFSWGTPTKILKMSQLSTHTRPPNRGVVRAVCTVMLQWPQASDCGLCLQRWPIWVWWQSMRRYSNLHVRVGEPWNIIRSMYMN